MAVNSNSVYLYNSSGTFTIPTGVTAVQIECFGASTTAYTYDSLIINGASYSKISNFNVSSGTALTVTIGNTGPTPGDTWVSNTGSRPTTISQGCLAYGASQTPSYQKQNNIGNVIFPGGEGLIAPPTGNTAAGGSGGPNGPGANAGPPYGTSPSITGGGSNGGSVGGNGFLPYGRTGSGATIGAGSGGYVPSTGKVSSTREIFGQASYVNNTLQNSLVNYGLYGGDAVTVSSSGCCVFTSVNGFNGFVVITLISPIKYIVVTQTGQSSLTMPSDCTGISSAIAIGAGGNGGVSDIASVGGGGGGGYSESTDITPANGTTVVGGTTVWCQLPAAGAGASATAYLRFGGATNTPPVASSQGVLANSGANNSNIVAGGAGATTTGAVGTLPNIRGGGAGGNGATVSVSNFGGGGAPAYKNITGAVGGNGYNGVNARGSGGGGFYQQQGVNGTASAGGKGGGVNGGTGATSTVLATSGTGGGGGGGYGNALVNGAVGSPTSLLGNVLLLGSGSGGNAGAGTVYYGAGGGGGFSVSNRSGGQGILIIVYTTNAYTTPITNGGFLQFI